LVFLLPQLWVFFQGTWSIACPPQHLETSACAGAWCSFSPNTQRLPCTFVSIPSRDSVPPSLLAAASTRLNFSPCNAASIFWGLPRIPGCISSPFDAFGISKCFFCSQTPWRGLSTFAPLCPASLCAWARACYFNPSESFSTVAPTPARFQPPPSLPLCLMVGASTGLRACSPARSLPLFFVPLIILQIRHPEGASLCQLTHPGVSPAFP